MKENKPLVSAAELEALIQDWGAAPHRSVDKFFPLRFWFVFMLTVFYALRLLFAPEAMAAKLSAEPVEIARLSNFLYFRGWFVTVAVFIGTYAYFKNWYFGIVFFCVLLVGSVNFVFDLFNVYAEQLAQPTPLLTLMLLMRIMVLGLIYVSVKNASRMPEGKDRINILLPFKSNV